MMIRAVTCVLFVAAASSMAAQDAREIVRRAVDRDRQNRADARDYTYLQRQDVRELDHAGQVKSRRIETWDITLLEGSPYRRLVARNDRPLSPEEQKSEDERQRLSDEQRQKETGEQRARRLADWQRRLDRQHDAVKEVPDAFEFTRLPDEQLEGRPVYRIDANPKPGFKPKSQIAAIFPKIKMRMWIDKADYEGAHVEMQVLDTISFGGFLLRLSKGSRMVIDQTRVSDGVWLPKQFSVTAAARILLLKGFNREFDLTFSDYKKFQVDSHVVAFSAKP